MPDIILAALYARKCFRHCGHTSEQVIPLPGTERLEGKADNKISDDNPLLHGDRYCCDGTDTGSFHFKGLWKSFSEIVLKVRPE